MKIIATAVPGTTLKYVAKTSPDMFLSLTWSVMDESMKQHLVGWFDGTRYTHLYQSRD